MDGNSAAPLWNRAGSPFRKTLRGDVEASIESCAKILPRDHRREFDELLFVEASAQPFDQFIRRAVRSRGQSDRVVQYRLLELVEGIAVLIVRKLCDLVFRYAVFSADGRADVESEQTPDHRRDL